MKKMEKEKKRGFLFWLKFNRQDNDKGKEPKIRRETEAISAGKENNAAAFTSAREETLSHTEAEILVVKKTSTLNSDTSVPVEDVLIRDKHVQHITTEIISFTEHVATRRNSALVNDKTLMSTPALLKNDADTPISKDNILASLIVADAAAPKKLQDASGVLTLAANITPKEKRILRPASAGMPPSPEQTGFFARLKNRLVKTRLNLGSVFVGLFRDKKIDDDLFKELEEQLLVADVGVKTTRKIIESLTIHAKLRHLKTAEALYSQLRLDMEAILDNVERPLEVTGKTPFVILMVGVNGVGKTTTIGKLARQFKAKGKSVMLAAGDTFRAAAVEQLQIWGERNRIPVVAQQTGADSASVIFDAIQAAKSRGIDVLIADTAGRLQNKTHLIDQLKKIIRVMKKLDVEAPHEVMLTLDASTGQNAVSQADVFNNAVGLTGIVLTKLDGTAKGGIIFAVADRFNIPIRYIGLGEDIEDLQPFKSKDFIEALFAQED